jgi:hypothetical protein
LLNSLQTKLYLSKTTGLSLKQIKNWFINTRKRTLKPLKREDSMEDNSNEPVSKVRFTGRRPPQLLPAELPMPTARPPQPSPLPSNLAFPQPLDPNWSLKFLQAPQPPNSQQIPAESLRATSQIANGRASDGLKQFDAQLGEYFEAYLKNFPYFLMMRQYALSNMQPDAALIDISKQAKPNPLGEQGDITRVFPSINGKK